MYKQGDVVLLPFPPTNQFASLAQARPKNRPAVIVSADWFFYLRGDYVVIALTSQPKRDCFDLEIRDYKQAGLLKPSVARIGKFLTVHPIIIIKKLGELTEDDQKNVLGRTMWPFCF